MTSDLDRRELCRLASQVLDGTASDGDLARLELLLVADANVRQLYYKFIALHSQLTWNLSEERSLHHPFEVASGDLAASGQQPVVGAEIQKSAFPIRSTSSPVLGFLSRATTALNRPITWSILTVAVAFYGTFLLFSWNLRPDQSQCPADVVDSSVAIVDDTVDVHWSEGAEPKANDSPIVLNESLKIDSGVIQLTLKRGAAVSVKGPASWSIDGDNVVSLKHGELVANVPKQATGFTVQTSNATLVDLGTEFGVEADAHGATVVQVFQGRVELRPDSKQSGSQAANPVFTLNAGEARRVERVGEKGTPVVREIAPIPNRFSQRTTSIKSRQLAAGALASSEGGSEFGRGATNLINGSGISKGAHTNVADGTMWHSMYGKAKGEFVLFDFFRPCRLESMKVWNYNEGVHHSGGYNINAFEERGLAQADIYVSATGKGDPISQPQEWQLVVEDQKFTPADGTATYTSPDVIPLGNVEAQFAAIVVDARHRADRVIDPPGECVGLSEVQFFGERVPPKQKLK